MAGIRRHRRRLWAILVLVPSIWFAGGFVVHRHISDQKNTLQLIETSDQLIRRAEKIVDFVVIASMELLLAGRTTCSDETREMMRQLVVDTGTAADIHLITQNATCSSFGSLSARLPTHAERAAWTEARNPAYRVGKMEGRHEKSLIGVSSGFGTDLEMIVAFNADAILFDVLPDELRGNGNVYLSVKDEVISRFVGDLAQNADDTNWASFLTNGARYPLSVDIRIDPVALSEWQKDISTLTTVLWAALGCLITAMAASASVRGQDPELEAVLLALKNHEINPYFQPIFNLETGNVIGCEALARWIKPGKEQISPGHFIPIVEHHRLDNKLLSVMLAQAARSFRPELRARPDFYLSFNVTPDQMGKADFADFLIGLTHQHGLKPCQICIEITERQIIACPDEVAQNTAKISAAGFQVAIDDAGTGHNGLAAIQTLAVDTIKIDKFFVDHINDEPRSRVMVDLFVSMARRYGMKTVAEGAETIEQINALRSAGVDAVQGFFYSKPVPASDFIVALNSSWLPSADIPATNPLNKSLAQT